MSSSTQALMKASKEFPFVSLLFVAVFLFSGPTCPAQLKVRVSVKLLYNNSDTNNPIPPGGAPGGVVDTNHCGSLYRSAISCEAEILEKFAYINKVMDRFGRGYRFEPIEVYPLTNPPLAVVDGVNITNSVWTLNALRDAVAEPIESALSLAAKANPGNTGFAYRSNAINFYVFDYGTAADVGGGYADNEVIGNNNDVCVTSQGGAGSWPRFLHEMGHYLGLYHTHGVAGGSTDYVCDTLFDPNGSSNLTLDELSQANFLTNFLNLADAQKQQVLDVFYNIMSYHADNGKVYNGPAFDPDSISLTTTNTIGNIRHRLTRDQLDRISNRFNNLATIGAVSGRTVFVMKSYNPCNVFTSEDVGVQVCGCDQAPRTISGSSTNPPVTIAAGLALTGSDANHDVLLVRAGNYTENLTINQRVSIRATRGTVRIGQ